MRKNKKKITHVIGFFFQDDVAGLTEPEAKVSPRNGSNSNFQYLKGNLGNDFDLAFFSR